MIDDETLAHLVHAVGRAERSWSADDLTRLMPLFDALAAREERSPQEVIALARGLSDSLDEDSARALSEGAACAAEVAERFVRMRALVAAHDALRDSERR